MLQVFNFESTSVHCYGAWDKPEWIANEVIEILYPEAPKTNRAKYLQKVPAKWKGMKRIHTPGGEQDVVTLLEPGLYFFINRSNSPKAQPFQDWLCEEVLPSIRKNGTYSLPQQSQPKALPPLTQENRLKLVELGSKLVELRHDERLLMALQAEVKNLLLPAQAEPSQPKLMSATEWLGTIGYRPPTKKENWLGRKIAEKWRLERNSEPTTAPKFVGTNHETQIKVYPEDFLPTIIEVTESYCDVDLRQTTL